LANSNEPERTYIEVIMPEKIRINLEYQLSASVWRDLGVVWKTGMRMIK
jgi:lipopolysaccharide/colanic/teichoic acid biosynthesis glycosyltransferase